MGKWSSSGVALHSVAEGVALGVAIGMAFSKAKV